METHGCIFSNVKYQAIGSHSVHQIGIISDNFFTENYYIYIKETLENKIKFWEKIEKFTQWFKG